MQSYKGMKIAITGADGFLGRALSLELHKRGAEVAHISGDLRNINELRELNPSYNMLFHFASPSSQILFKRNLIYCIDSTLNSFINVARMCKLHGIKLIYPSTGVLSQGATNEYSLMKKICEDIHKAENLDALGLRIFATYGIGESHKGDYASVPYLFASQMILERNPVIYGDGSQSRDFIYIDDVVNSVLEVATSERGVMDIGSGESVSFNQLIEAINKVLGKQLSPTYVDKPVNYVENTQADKRSHEFYKPKVSLEEGIRKVVESLKETK